MEWLIAVPLSYPVDETTLSVSRREKAAQYQKEDDRKRSLCAGVALDNALLHIGLRENDTAVAYTSQGKPFLPDYPEWHISLSHSGNWAVCLLSDAPSSVDIQQYRDGSFIAIAERHFSAAECAALQAFSPKEQQRLFFRLWCAKECVLKLRGTGLSGALSSVPVTVGETLAVDDGILGEYPMDGHQLTVVTTGQLPCTVEIIE